MIPTEYYIFLATGLFIIGVVGWWYHPGPASRTATDIIIIWSIIWISTLQSDSGKPVRIGSKKFDSWHSWRMCPSMVRSHAGYMCPGTGGYQSGNDYNVFHTSI